MQSDFRELGSLSEWAVAWATDRTEPSRGGSGSCDRCVGRDIEYNNVERARRPSLRGGRDRKLATCQRQFAQRLRYARFGRERRNVPTLTRSEADGPQESTQQSRRSLDDEGFRCHPAFSKDGCHG